MKYDFKKEEAKGITAHSINEQRNRNNKTFQLELNFLLSIPKRETISQVPFAKTSI